jgi:hypothetical protein
LKIALVLLLAPAGFAPSQAPAALRQAVARADQAIRTAACSAERRFGEGDPDANAARCGNLHPPAGVQVGRTSARLRNPRNVPPAWARAYVQASALGDLRGFWWAEAEKAP